MRRVLVLLSSLAFYPACDFGTLFAAEISVLPGPAHDQTAIVISGPIEEGDDRRFRDIAESIPQANVLLESPGGEVTAGISIAAEIANRHYTTLVLDGAGCHSICAVIWVAGTRRSMSLDADISVHAAYRTSTDASGEVEMSESGAANAQIGAFLNEIGLSREAIQYFTLSGPSDALLDITPEVAQALSIDVYVQTPIGIVTPAERPTPRRIARQVSEYSGLAGNCSWLFQLDGAVWKAQARVVLSQGHSAFGGEALVPLLEEFVGATKVAIEEAGVARWCLTAEQNLRADGLQTGITGPSYDCSKSSSRTEFAVCAAPDLWAKDRAMSGLYRYYRDGVETDRSRELISSQGDWLVTRDRCGDDVDCLRRRYLSRLLDFGL